MNLLYRILGSIFDKLFIVILFVVAYFIVYQNSALVYLGVFWGGCFYEIPNSYQFMEAVGCQYSLKEIDLNVAVVFCIVNFVYYFLFESTLHASLGKFIMGGVCTDCDDNKITVKYSFYRSLSLILFMAVAIMARFLFLQISYFFLILIFFCIIDLPVLFSHESLVDIITQTNYVGRKTLTDDVEIIKSNSSELKTGKTNSSVYFRFFVVSVFIVLLSFLIRDFCKGLNRIWLMNYFINKNKSTFVYKENEQLSFLKGTTFFGDSLKCKSLNDLQKCGPVPDGHVLSTIGGTGDDTYSIARKVRVKRYDMDINPYSGRLYTNYDKPYWDWDWEYENKNFSYNYCLTTIDLSKSYANNEDSEVITDILYQKYKLLLVGLGKLSGSTDNLKELLYDEYSAPVNWRGYCDRRVKNKYFLIYRTADGKGNRMLRSVIFANKKAYVLDVCSKFHDVKNTDNLLRQFTTYYIPGYDKINEWRSNINQTKLCILIIVLIIVLVLYSILHTCKKEGIKMNLDKCGNIVCLFAYISFSAIFYSLQKYFPRLGFKTSNGHCSWWSDLICDDTFRTYIFLIFLFMTCSIITVLVKCYTKKTNVRNVTLMKIFSFIVCMSILNVIICLLQINYINKYTLYGECWFFLHIFVGTTLINCISLPYIMGKMYCKKTYSIIPKCIKYYFIKRKISEPEQKSFLSFIAYPLFILGNLPFGICVMAYIIPILILFFSITELNHLNEWINGKSSIKYSSSNKFVAIFKDYYLILDLPITASEEDVNAAYNKIIARSNTNPGMYGKQFINDVNEAYRVLSSTNRIRLEYDKEYSLYKVSNEKAYKYSNVQTEKDIFYIQKSMVSQKGALKRKFPVKNAIFLSMIIYIIIVFITISVWGISNVPG